MLRVLASNKATRGVILGYFGSLRRHGGLTGVKRGFRGGLECPFNELLIPLKVSYGI